MDKHIVNATGNVVLDEPNKTVTITQPEYSLQKGHFMPGYHHVIYATTVTVKRSYKNPGRDLTIYAASIIVADKKVGGRIDVTGADGESHGAGRNAVTGRLGTFDGGDGYEGQNGGDGHHAGNIKLCAGKIEGTAIEFAASGGAGGRAQDGGDGTAGSTPTAARDAIRPTRPWGVTDGGWDRNVSELVPGVNRNLQRANEAERGARGGHGGNAGLPGIPGRGGNGGAIDVHTILPVRLRLSKTVNAGSAGAVGNIGTPGAGATGGLGGKFLYRTNAGFIVANWTTSDANTVLSRFWQGETRFNNFRVSQYFLVGRGRNQKLRVRQHSGDAGSRGGYGSAGAGAKPRVPKASRGTKGSLSRHAINDSTMFQTTPLRYAVMLQGSVAVAVANQDKEEAANILRWLIMLSSAFKSLDGRNDDSAREMQLIYREAEQQLLSLPYSQMESAATRFLFTNITAYSEFVGGSIQRVVRQQEQLNEFRGAIAESRSHKALLRRGIREAEHQISFLTGNDTEAGSIEFFKNQETQIKHELGNLDVQLLNLRVQLGHMPDHLQNQFAKRSAISLQDVLEVFLMAAGLVINIASSISSLSSMVTKAKAFYTEMLVDLDWADKLENLLWNREFIEFANDASKLMGSKEWESLTKNGRSLVVSAIDFHAKIEAYNDVLSTRENAEFTVDVLDVQAKVLIFDVAKLQLKIQRTQLEAELRIFLDEYDVARTWKHRFTDFFDTSMTRFSMLAHLSDIAAQRMHLENQRSLAMRNLRTMQEQLNWAGLDASLQNRGAVVDILNADLSQAFTHSLADIADLHRAYRIWTLEDQPLRRVKNKVGAPQLQNLYDDIALRIRRRLAVGNEPARRTATYTREFDFSVAELRDNFFDEGEACWRFPVTVPLELESSVFFQRLIDVNVFLAGAIVERNSAFLCVLRHSGISRFLNRHGEEVVAFQMPREVRFSYVLKDGRPNYSYRGAVTNPFDRGEWDRRIRYSPHTSWELVINPDYKLDRLSRTFNHNIDWSGFTGLDLNFEAYFEA